MTIINNNPICGTLSVINLDYQTPKSIFVKISYFCLFHRLHAWMLYCINYIESHFHGPLTASDIEQLNRYPCGGYSDESTIVYLSHPCKILTSLEVRSLTQTNHFIQRRRRKRRKNRSGKTHWIVNSTAFNDHHICWEFNDLNLFAAAGIPRSRVIVNSG